LNHGPDWHIEDKRFAVLAVLVVVPAGPGVSGLVQPAVMEKSQRRKRRVGFYDNVSSTPAVAPIGPAEGYELGAPEGDGSVSPVSRPDLYGYLIQHSYQTLIDIIQYLIQYSKSV
jgi:hypothetical protein